MKFIIKLCLVIFICLFVSSCKPVFVLTLQDVIGLSLLGIMIVVGIVAFIGYQITNWWKKFKWRS